MEDTEILLLRSVYDLLKKQDRSIYVINLLAEEVAYCGEMISGESLMEQIEELLDNQ